MKTYNEKHIRELKRTKEFIDSYTSFAIVGHKEPDGDCLCSQLTTASLLSKLGKRSVLLSPGPFVRPEIMHLEQEFHSSLETGIRETGVSPEAAIIVDCSTAERIGDLGKELEGTPSCVIDHHASGDSFGRARFVDPDAPSVTLMIFQLYRFLRVRLEKEDAQLLMFGLCTDTGYFRHLGKNGADAFRVSADLVECGASAKETFHDMYGNRSLQSRTLLGLLLSRTESYFDGRFLLTYETLEDTGKYGRRNRDSDSLYQQLQAVAGCEGIALIREESETESSVGLRSLHDLDVGALAQRLGGGGHRNAAGYSVKGRVSEIRSALLEELEREL